MSVSADNKYYIDGQEVSAEALGSTIKTQAKNYPDGLMIQTDGNATHGAVVKVMDSARNSGVTSISVSEV